MICSATTTESTGTRMDKVYSYGRLSRILWKLTEKRIQETNRTSAALEVRIDDGRARRVLLPVGFLVPERLLSAPSTLRGRQLLGVRGRVIKTCKIYRFCKICKISSKFSSNAYFLAKFRFGTAENEPAKNLQNFAIFPNSANPNRSGYLPGSRHPPAKQI